MHQHDILLPISMHLIMLWIVDRQTADRSYNNRQQIRSQTHNQSFPHNQQYPHQINNGNTGQRNQMNNNAAYNASPGGSRLSTPTVELQHRVDAPTEYHFGDVTRSMVNKGKTSSGRSKDSPYQFGDFTRGLFGRKWVPVVGLYIISNFFIKSHHLISTDILLHDQQCIGMLNSCTPLYLSCDVCFLHEFILGLI